MEREIVKIASELIKIDTAQKNELLIKKNLILVLSVFYLLQQN